ncbi:MAG: anti-sigma factor family protein [Blastocatellia bacterium]
MNCRRIEKLIPLYVGGDLDVNKADAVLAHASTCARCNGLVAEYEHSRRWLRSYTPPDFDDASLEDLKRSVLADIEGRTARASFLNGLARRWAQGLAIASASAALIALAALAFYAYQQKTNEFSGREDLAAGSDVKPEAAPSEVASQPEATKQAPGAGSVRKTRRHSAYAARVAAPPAVIGRGQPAERLEVKEARQVSAWGVKDALSGEQGTPPGMLRIEIQTNDPRIRIIWFSPKGSTAHRTKPTTESD